ncbi:hypothetical protein ACQP2Y_23075 [Actinoplanes sp. CA-051413]
MAPRLFPGLPAGRDLIAAVWYPGSDATTGDMWITPAHAGKPS